MSNPEARKNYDENSGLFSPIKSKTVSITASNYKRFVEESNDLWIIQVYEDGNPSCLAFAEMWDEMAKQYGGIVKFGRVNAVSQIEVLRHLPFHVKFFPTVISLVPGYYPDIFVLGIRNAQVGKLLEDFIVNYE